MAIRAMAQLPVTPDERDFADPETQRLWHLALKAIESASKGE
jgi:hypothetical protein